jgi:hypothetical protein
LPVLEPEAEQAVQESLGLRPVEAKLVGTDLLDFALHAQSTERQRTNTGATEDAAASRVIAGQKPACIARRGTGQREITRVRCLSG